jgi:hypothetical protein
MSCTIVVSAVVVCMLTDIALPVSDMIAALSDPQTIARPLPQICQLVFAVP